MDDQFVSIRVAELRHPANRSLVFVQIERDATLFQFLDCLVDVRDFERHRGSIARRFPGGMTTDADRHRPEIVFDPCAFHCDHGQGSFSFSGLSLWMMILLPSGSFITAMWQHGLSNGSASNGTCRSFKRLIASSKFSISNATLVPSSAGFH